MFASLRRFSFGLLAVLALAMPLSAQDDRNIRFGKPKRDPDAKFVNPKLEDHHIDDRPQYNVSYNGKKNTANWVSWNLRKSDVGKIERSDNWQQDKSLPDFFDVVDAKIYKNTGFDKGHLCPSKDRSATQADNDATFTFTNCIPQAPKNNQQGWRIFEDYCRDLALEGNDLHIVCGPIGRRGQNKGLDFLNFLVRDKVKVTVPHDTWKVLLILPHDKAEPDARTRTIAVVMPNDQSVTTDWAIHRVSWEHVEELTDFQLFPKIPKAVRDVLRERVDSVEIPKSKKGKKKKKDKAEEVAAVAWREGTPVGHVKRQAEASNRNMVAILGRDIKRGRVSWTPLCA